MRVNFFVYLVFCVFSMVSFAGPEDQEKVRVSERIAAKKLAQEEEKEQSELEKRNRVLMHKNYLLLQELEKCQQNYKFLVDKLTILKEVNEFSKATAAASCNAHEDESKIYEGGGSAAAAAAPDEETEDEAQLGGEELDLDFASFGNQDLSRLAFLRKSFDELSCRAEQSRFEIQKVQKKIEKLEREIQATIEILSQDGSSREEAAF